jgi:serine O-acetyltransferase
MRNPLPQPGDRNGNPADLPFWSLVAEDYVTHGRDLWSQGFWALFWHRFGNCRMQVRPRLLRLPFSLLYRVGAKLTEWVGGIFLPYTVRVGRRVRLDHFGGMILVAQSIGDDVVIRQNTTFGIARVSALQDRPRIGNRVDIGAGAVLIGAITIGDGAVIGANAVVTSDVPPGAIMAGVPARQIGPR